MAKSCIFKAGQKIPTTMLTVIGPAMKGTWASILCQCDCGKRVVFPYATLYRGQFSCGCRRRGRFNAVDYRDMKITNQAGNNGTGRTLTILERAEDDSGWLYICDCCQEVMKLSRGMDSSVVRSLKDIGGQVCPNWLEFIHWKKTEKLLQWIGHRPKEMGSGECSIRAYLVQRYPPERIKYNETTGEIEGFYGMPPYWEGDLMKEGKRVKRAEPLRYPVRFDEDRFRGFMPSDAELQKPIEEKLTRKRSRLRSLPPQSDNITASS